MTVKYLRKGADVLRSIDYAVPGILIGQAIGRWGNFFNFEVYGFEVSRNAWNFLPNFVLNQMQVTTSNPSLINVPLFLVESIIMGVMASVYILLGMELFVRFLNR